MKDSLTLYTDGASRGNPGPGGWGTIVIGTDVAELAGAKNPATNNQMELQAVIEGLSFIKEKHPEATVALHADSRYVLNGIESWLDGWVRKGWVTMAKKPVENRGQWEELLALRDHFGKRLTLTKVDGHSGHLYNDRCDELAVSAALGTRQDLVQSKPFIGSLKAYEQFLSEYKPSSPIKTKNQKTKSSAPAFSYVSIVDGVVHADKDWTSCEKRVKGKKGAKYKKVFSKSEETDLIQDYTLASLL